MFSLKRKIWHFHVLVVQNRSKNYKKSVMHVLPTEPIGFFDVLVAVASLDLKVPSQSTHFRTN